MDKSQRRIIEQELSPLIEKKMILGIFLFGSSTSSKGRDTDICLIVGRSDKKYLQSVLSKTLQQVSDKYDLWLFEELKIYMQAEVLSNHVLLWTKDESGLYEYLYPFYKQVNDYHYRLKVAYDD